MTRRLSGSVSKSPGTLACMAALVARRRFLTIEFGDLSPVLY